MKRTISTFIGLLALLTGGLVATTGVALAAPATTYVVAVWSMPTYAGPTTPTWPQALVGSVASPTASLGAADGIIPSTCGKQYQVDVYVAGDTTASLLRGGVLTSPNHPPEALAPGGWGTAYKIVKTDACPPELITVTPQTPDVTPPTCEADGTLVLPTGPEGVKYVVKPAYTGPGEYTITAKALKGYVLVAAEHEWAWDLTVAPKLTGTQCQTTPPPPVVTPGPANPQAKIVTTCGHAVFTLSNLTPQTYDESATFVTTIDGKDSTAVTVKAGDTQELGWAPVADTGTYAIGVRVGDTMLATGTVESKCGQGGGVTPPPVTPPAAPPAQPVANVTELPHTGGGSALPYAGVGLLLLLLGSGVIWMTRKVS